MINQFTEKHHWSVIRWSYSRSVTEERRTIIENTFLMVDQVMEDRMKRGLKIEEGKWYAKKEGVLFTRKVMEISTFQNQPYVRYEDNFGFTDACYLKGFRHWTRGEATNEEVETALKLRPVN